MVRWLRILIGTLRSSMGGAGAEPVPAVYRGHRGQHYAATAWAVGSLVDRRRVERIVLPAEDRAARTAPRSVVAGLSRRVVGVVPGAGHESMTTIAGREAAHLAQSEGAAAVDRLLDAAAKEGRASNAGTRSYVAKDERSAYEGGDSAVAQGQGAGLGPIPKTAGGVESDRPADAEAGERSRLDGEPADLGQSAGSDGSPYLATIWSLILS
jgi:hypothetical protein